MSAKSAAQPVRRGLEGDVDGSPSASPSATTYYVSGLFRSTPPVSGSLGVQGSIRGRIRLRLDRVLLYATAASPSAASTAASRRRLDMTAAPRPRVGWTVGGGPNTPSPNNWSVRAEFATPSSAIPASTPTTRSARRPFTSRASLRSALTATARSTRTGVQVGFSYKFDTAAPAPVVAKY